MNDNGKFLLGLAAGIGVGTVLGLLIAPDKGTVTYKKVEGAIKDAANDLFEYGAETVKSAKNELHAVKNHN
ncbi:YtxH domain-containing protein [Fulvivirga sp. 29W222]|uniref:YtxH domain-containing protein n=1 Tax=Fulvivirga marina TaxID=2494733 RepID=A0A937FU72_9BACT|nr:YtxH domain-containing protein [Fulvivirga marina]MBL6446039.1 YtxH domain-containing protein [Fulvivirga marina]